MLSDEQIKLPFTFFPDDEERYRIFQMKPVEVATTLDLYFNMSLRMLHEIWRTGDYTKLFRTFIAFNDIYGNSFSYFSPSKMVNNTFDIMKYYYGSDTPGIFAEEVVNFYRDILQFSYLSQLVLTEGYDKVYKSDMDIEFATQRGSVPIPTLSEEVLSSIDVCVNLITRECIEYEGSAVFLLRIFNDPED